MDKEDEEYGSVCSKCYHVDILTKPFVDKIKEEGAKDTIDEIDELVTNKITLNGGEIGHKDFTKIIEELKQKHEVKG